MAGATGQVAGANGPGAGAAGPEAGANLSNLQILGESQNIRGDSSLITGTNLNQTLQYGPPLKERVRKPKRSERNALTEEYLTNLMKEVITPEEDLVAQNKSDSLQESVI